MLKKISVAVLMLLAFTVAIAVPATGKLSINVTPSLAQVELTGPDDQLITGHSGQTRQLSCGLWQAKVSATGWLTANADYLVKADTLQRLNISLKPDFSYLLPLVKDDKTYPATILADTTLTKLLQQQLGNNYNQWLSFFDTTVPVEASTPGLFLHGAKAHSFGQFESVLFIDIPNGRLYPAMLTNYTDLTAWFSKDSNIPEAVSGWIADLGLTRQVLNYMVVE